MSRLRRSKWEASPFPVAAEVCESRALLSAGAAVHSAVQHAALNHVGVASHAPPAPAATGPVIPVNVQVLTQGFIPFQATGQMTISPLVGTVGARVSAHISASFNSPGRVNVLNITLKGKVQNVIPHGTTTVIQFPPAGSMKVTETFDAGNVAHFTFKPTNPLIITFLNQDAKITGLETTFTHRPIHNLPVLPIDILAVPS